MRLAINARFLALPTTGIGQMLTGYLQALAALPLEHEYFLFTPQPHTLSLPSNFHTILLKDLPLPASFAKTFWETHSFPKAAQKHSCDILWSPYPAATLSSLPHLITVHDLIPWQDTRYQRFRTRHYLKLINRAFQKASAFHLVSSATQKDFQQTFPKLIQPQTVIHNALPFSPFHPQEGKPLFALPSAPFLFYLGGYDPRKNVPLLVELWAKYLAPQTEVHLVLGGQPPSANRLAESPTNLRQLVPANLQDRLHITGFLSEEDKYALYNHALAFVHLSSSEGFNLPLLEALAVGCPAAVSDLPIHHEVAAQSAVYLPLHQPREITARLLALISDLNQRKKLGELGRMQSQNFSYSLSAPRLLQALQDLL